MLIDEKEMAMTSAKNTALALIGDATPTHS